MKKFEVGKIYLGSNKKVFECTRRTNDFVTLVDAYGLAQRRKVKESLKYKGCEVFKDDNIIILSDRVIATVPEKKKEEYTKVKKGKKQEKNNKMIHVIYEFNIYTEVEENGKEIVKNIIKGDPEKNKTKVYTYKINKEGKKEKINNKITFGALKSGIYKGYYIIA